MTDSAVMEPQMILEVKKPPVAIGFLSSAPEEVEQWRGGPVPAGCFFWKKAQEGETFYTTPEDHYNCAVGAYTHKIPLPVERSGELEGTIGFMVEAGYLKMAEVPGIPTLAETPAFIAYGPVGHVPFVPDIVIVAAQPAQAMLLYEAAVQAGVTSALMSSLGRPACAVLPLSQQTGSAAISLGCRGNRTFTELSDDEMYVSIPGDKWPFVLDQYIQIAEANGTMGNHYTQHKAKFPVL